MVLISLMTSGVEHHFICLLAICILSLEKCVNSSEHFEIELFIVLMWSCMSCLYILDINPLLVISFANISPHLVGCLFVLLMVACGVMDFNCQMFNVMHGLPDLQNNLLKLLPFQCNNQYNNIIRHFIFHKVP